MNAIEDEPSSLRVATEEKVKIAWGDFLPGLMFLEFDRRSMVDSGALLRTEQEYSKCSVKLKNAGCC